MNLKAFVDGLTLEERRDLLNILTENSSPVEMLNNSDKPEPIEEDFLKKNNPEFTMNSEKAERPRRSTVKARQNTWRDEGEDRHIETPTVNPTPRNRKPPAKKAVTCSGCGKKENVQSSLVYGEYYRCSRCVGK
jgi:hypothetical protein